MTTIDNICLGTVKLGIPDYGFSSSNNKRVLNHIHFLKKVQDLGIYRFDTSPRYGNSESLLGEYIEQSNKKLFISTKIDNLKSNDPKSPKTIVEKVKTSLKKLNRKNIDVCYLHQNEMEIISDPYIHEGLSILKENKLINNSGASIYYINECDYAVESGIFDYIQLPVNIANLEFYNRFVKGNKTSVRFVARSLLLQGAFLNRSVIAEKIKQSNSIINYLKKIDILSKSFGISTHELILSFVFSLSGIDHFIIGTSSTTNLLKNIQCIDSTISKQLYNKIINLEPKSSWVNPREWN